MNANGVCHNSDKLNFYILAIIIVMTVHATVIHVLSKFSFAKSNTYYVRLTVIRSLLLLNRSCCSYDRLYKWSWTNLVG